MKKLLVILALFSTSFCFAQNLQNAHWRFPVNSGADFTTTSPPTPASSAINYTNYGGSAMPASVSDVNGNLLFYTDGINVWDNNNQQFATGLYGYSTNVRTAQKVVIVPKPGNANRYYIFTLGSINQSGVDPNGIGRGGIHYTVVDFVSGTWQINPAFINTSLKNVAGDLIDYPFDLAHTEDNAVFITGESRMTTTLNRTGDKVWVSIIADFYSNHRHTKKFLNYLVSANGISAQPDGVSTGPAVETSVVNPSYDNLEYSESSMKISPNGAFLCDGEDVADLFNYDNLNGTISFNKRIFDGTGYLGAPVGYGIEFSPNSLLAYITYTPEGIVQSDFNKNKENQINKPNKRYGLYQYSIENDTLQLIYSSPDPPPPQDINFPIPTPQYCSGMQLAIDDNIYVCTSPSLIVTTAQLGFIDDPNVQGTGCNFIPTCTPAIPSSLTLPQWVHQPLPPIPCVSTISCLPVNLIGCNYSTNGDFVPSGIYNPSNPAHVDDPFGNSLIPNWLATNGTPQITDQNTFPATIPPPGISNYAYLFSAGWGYQGNITSSGDGIAQKIPVLTPGNNYALSFFKKFVRPSLSPGQTQINMDKFYIVLMYCSNYSLIKTCDYTIAGFPANSQIVYCESNMNNSNWEQVVFNFTANSNYNMVWIFPKQAQNVFYNNGAGRSGVDFTGLEMIKVSNFSAGPTPAPTPPNCNVTIGNLNCGVANAVYTWYRPDNTQYSSSTNPNDQIITNLDASISQNVGIWRLEMTVPSATTPTGPCIQTQTTISASVTVPNTCLTSPPSTGPWVWMHGDNIPNQSGIYGTQGVPSGNNKPGAREITCSWTDLSGNLWLFGGHLGWANNNSQTLCGNDLWKYNTLTNQWTWVKGSDIVNQPAVYGTLGVPDIANTPGARSQSQCWTDLSGNLWLFGGIGSRTYPTPAPFYSDLWKYDIATNQWTWVKGSNLPNESHNYGTIGVPASTNTPGCRSLATTWVDNLGNLWMYGGNSNAYGFADLWKYEISTNLWTAVKIPIIGGGGCPVFGTKGVPNIANQPGTRYGMTSWVDASGDFWLFGGNGYGSNCAIGAPFGALNDLWRYNINSNMWTWISGDDIVSQPGVYGTQGIGSPSNKPGSKSSPISWVDKINGNLWLFGGVMSAYYDDLWKFNISSSVWTWVSGSNTINQIGVYGTIGAGSPITKPGSRCSSVGWRDQNNGNLWLFGGYGIGATQSQYGLLNDLWKYTGNCTGPNCFTDPTNYTTKPHYSSSQKTSIQKNSFKLSISPNPITSNTLNLSIFENDKLSLNSYTVMVTNKMGTVLMQKNNHFSGKGIDISRLGQGVYFVTVVNKKNEKLTAIFSKL